MTFVFFSYHQADREEAWGKIELLKAYGMSVWDYACHPSRHEAASIAAGLDQSEQMVCLESSTGLESDWVRHEISLAEPRMPVLKMTRKGARCENEIEADDNEELVARVVGYRPPRFESDREDRVATYRASVLGFTVAVVSAPLVGVLLGFISSVFISSSGREDVHSGWWGQLERGVMLGIPGHLALGLGVLVTIQLMTLTWCIANTMSGERRHLAVGQSESWTAATAIILAMSGVGIHFSLLGGVGLPAQAIVGILSMVAPALFFADGYGEALRLGILIPPWRIRWMLVRVIKGRKSRWPASQD